MLSAPVRAARGFSLITVMTAVALLSLLTLASFHQVLDHRRRAALSADHALALHAAEIALTAAECELSASTGTPNAAACPATPAPERSAALDPLSLAGFPVGACGQGSARSLCRPLPGQSLWAQAGLLEDRFSGVEIDAMPQHGTRQPARRARYVIEPIADALPNQWMHAGAAPRPHLFRVTAAGFGADPRVSVILQTVFRPRLPGP